MRIFVKNDIGMSTIKKLWGRIAGWFLYTFLNPVLFRSENGGFKVVFRRYSFTIPVYSFLLSYLAASCLRL